MDIKNLNSLDIHKMSQAQYEREVLAGTLDENALYLIPDVGVPTNGTEGQFLRIVNGIMAWSTVPNAEDNTFGI